MTSQLQASIATRASQRRLQNRHSLMRRPWLVVLAACMLFPLLPAGAAHAQTDEEAEPIVEQPAETPPARPAMKKKDREAKLKKIMKPTEVGIRFTPRMAKAMSKAFTKEMTKRYDLDEKQTGAVNEAISFRLMEFVQENAATGRDLIEMMAETMMENDGEFPKEAAQQFAIQAKPIIPALKGLFADAAADISKEMTFKQRMKFTADMTAATAGIALFESRMKRWEEGKVGTGANPFWDPADNDPDKATSQPAEPDEHPEYRRARQNVERTLKWHIDIDERWEGYVNNAASYYDFEESQLTAAQAILKDCRERAKAIKTPKWRDTMRVNRIAQRLTWRAGGESYGQGPWMFHLEEEFNRLLQPLSDLEEEMKKRIEDIPDSTQRAKALEKVHKSFAELGMEEIDRVGAD